MVTSTSEPVVTIKNLLEDNWNSSNTSNITPKFKDGFIEKRIERPLITVSGAEESPIDGGQTGFVGIQSGKGPAKLMDGTLQVDCWDDQDNRRTDSVNAKIVVYEFSEEIKRITTEEVFNAQDLRYISWIGRTQQPDATESPTVFRQQCLIRFGYFILP